MSPRAAWCCFKQRLPGPPRRWRASRQPPACSPLLWGVGPFLAQRILLSAIWLHVSSLASHIQELWKLPVQCVLFFFGLVNAGVEVASVGPGTWIVLAAIVLGKPLGTVSCTAAGVAAGMHLTAGVVWRNLIVLGLVAAIGLTVALFFATAAFFTQSDLSSTVAPGAPRT